MSIKFVDQLPEPTKGTRGSMAPILQALRANPGQWAEIDRYPVEDGVKARNRGSQTASRHRDIEYTARKVSDQEVVLYMRAVSA